ncbi:MAG: hypothetical protein QOI24_3053 [Acidobacteriota bacterium]|jgi:CHAT domain-containing protein|nr:hypothetical protein [Acidobacteriota bacterium]
MEHHGFPSEETLAAFIDGRLDVATHNGVVVHINACDDCYAIVLASSERHLPLPRMARPPRRRLYLIAAIASVLIVAALAAVAIRIRRHDPLADFAAQVEHRRIESRIAGFRYLPYESPLRDAAEIASDSEKWKLIQYAGPISDRVKKEASPKNLHDLAVSHLVIGNYDQAVAAIELALTTETHEPNVTKALAKSKDATLLSDAAAIYLARAKARRVSADWIAALEASERAWKLAQQPEIAWNRALATESQHVTSAAIAAWEDYLRLDPKSPWAAEAKERIAKLRAPTDAERWQQIEPRLGALAEDPRVLDGVVAQFAQQARVTVEESLLPAWGEAELAGDATRADDRLSTARAVAASLRRLHGATLDDEAIRSIDGSRGPARLQLARGHAAFGAGRKLYDGRAFERANESFRAASKELRGTPFAPLARLQEIGCMLMRDDYAGTVAAVAELGSVPPTEHPLLGRITWINALAELDLGHPDRAIELYRVAEEHFKTAHEDDNLAVIQGLLADAHESVGDSDAAMPYRMSALSGIARTGATRGRNVIMAEAAYAAMTANRNATAQLFLLPLMNDRSPQGGSLWRCTALIWSSSLRAADGDREGASQDIHRARASCGAISDESVRHRTIANMSLAENAAPSDPIEGMKWLNDALAFFRESRNPLGVANLLDRRGRAQRDAHDEKKAESDFREAVAVIESQRDRISDDEQRDAFLTGAGRIYADLVDLLLSQQRYVEAFEIVERSRSAEVSHSHHGSGRKSRPHSEWLRARLSPDTAIVEYVLLGDSLITWLITANDIGAMRTDVHRERLAALADRAAATRDSNDLAKLYELLVAPWAKNVAAGSTIVFVPDPAITRVPFSALLNRKNGRFLADEYAAAVAPSALSFVANAMEYVARSGDRALLVADPTLDPSRYATLPPLDGARDEVESVAKFYPRATSLVGDAATKESFLRLASTANVIHFAGHAIANDAAPRYSSLLFGGTDGSDGRLYVGDLASAGFEHVRLAVLSACSTARGSRERRGTATVARAFLSAGVPAVVGTLWPVNDDVAEAFSRVFHQSIQKGRMPAAALRDAQLALMKSPEAHLREPSSWGAFRLIGAATLLKEDHQCPLCVSSSQVSAR